MSNMSDADKLTAFKALLDGDEELVKETLDRIDNTEKQADAMGISFKEQNLKFDNVEALLEFAIKQAEAETDEAEDFEEIEEKAEDEEAEDPKPKKGQTDYTMKMEGMVSKMGGYMDRMEKMLGSRAKQSDSVMAVTEAANAHSARLAKLETLIPQMETQLKDALKELRELQADVPAGLANDAALPTERDDNILDEEAQKDKEPNDVDRFFDFVSGGFSNGVQ